MSESKVKVTGANAQGLDLATARFRRGSQWIASVSERVRRLETLVAQSRVDLEKARQAIAAVASGRPAPELDTCLGSRIDQCEPHGAEVHVLIGERWCTIEGVSSMTFGTMGLGLMIDQYRAVHRLCFDAKDDPTAPLAWRFVVNGELVEAYGLVPLEPWEWRAPCVGSVQMPALVAQVPPS